jgi:hypothetical protein
MVITLSCSGVITAYVFSLSQNHLLKLRNFLKMGFSEINVQHIHSFMRMFETNVEAPQREGTSVIEMLTVLHSVHTLNAEKLASKCVTLKTKHLVTQILEDGLEEECKEFLQHVERLHISCIVYLNV